MSDQNSNTVQVQGVAGQQPAQTVLTLVPSSSSLPQPGQAQPTVGTGQVKQTQHIVINTNNANGNTKIVIQSPGSMHTMSSGESVKIDPGTNQQQEKANKIIAEAIAKAQKSGNTSIPRLIEPPELPAILKSMNETTVKQNEGENKTKKRKRSRKEKEKDEPSEKDEQTPKKKRNRKKKKEEAPVEPAKVDVEHTVTGQDKQPLDVDSDGSPKDKKSKKPKKPIGRPPKEKKKKRYLEYMYLAILPYCFLITFSQTTNFRLFQTEGVCRRQFHI